MKKAIHFILPDGSRISGFINDGETVSASARRLGVPVRTPCGGVGRCGKCRMINKDGQAILACRRYEPGEYSIPEETLAGGTMKIDSSTGFEIPMSDTPGVETIELDVPAAQFDSGDNSDMRRLQAALRLRNIPDPVVPLRLYPKTTEVLAQTTRASATLLRVTGIDRLTDLRPSDAGSPLFAVACDIGTTTVAARLIDCSTGAIIATAARMNRQFTLADDVASRITAAEADGGLKELQRLVVAETLSPVIDELCGDATVGRDRIGAIIVAANSIMTHLLLGWPVRGFGRVPFNGVSLEPPVVDASSIGLTLADGAPLFAFPSLAAYIGGDIAAGIAATSLLDRKETTLFVDLGTNCEMALAHNGEYTSCSTPAGPAFEGEGITCSSPAAPGAIERVRFNPDGITFDVIGGFRPRGLCGSALVDILGRGVQSGLLGPTGRLKRDASAVDGSDRSGRRARSLLIAPESLTAPGVGDIYITEREIATLLQAKAAVAAGIQTLLDAVGLAPGDIDEILFAGGFAKYIDVESALACGLLPKAKKITIAGNTSLAGATGLIRDRRLLNSFAKMKQAVRVIELNRQPTFERNYVDAMMLG